MCCQLCVGMFVCVCVGVGMCVDVGCGCVLSALHMCVCDNCIFSDTFVFKIIWILVNYSL